MTTSTEKDPDAPKISAIVEYNEVENALDMLREEFAGKAFDLTTTAGDKQAREVRAKFVKLRTRLEAIRKEQKAPILARGRLLDAEHERIERALLALEKPIDEQIKADERRRAAEAAEKARIERERVAALRKRISHIQDAPRAAIGNGTATIAMIIEKVESEKIGPDFGEFVDEAMAARATSLEALRALHAQAVQAEAAAKALQEARAEAKRLADAQAAREAQEAEDRRLKAIQDAADASFDMPAEKIEDPNHDRAFAPAERPKGYDIPIGTNPLANLDPSEVVIPIARPARQAAPIVSAPVSAPAPIARPSASAWSDQVQRPRAATPASVEALPRSLVGVPSPDLALVSVPKALIENLIRASEVGDADQDEEWNEILNDFRKLIGAPLVEFVA